MTRILLSLLALCLSTPALAYKVRCNEQQNECEVDTKRLVAGDRVGIFSESGLIVAIGTVKKLKGRIRIVDIDKKYAPIKRSHELVLIKDEEAQNPEAFFKFFKPAAKLVFGAGLGFENMGIGESFPAIDAQAFVGWQRRENLYFVGRFMFLNGAGSATHETNALQKEDITLNYIGLGAGIAYILFPENTISFRGEFALGIGPLSGTITGGQDFKTFVDSRVAPGTVPFGRFEGAAIIRWGDWQPYIQANFLRLQNSNNTGIGAGLLFDF